MTDIQLDRIERIKRALVGQPVDRPPISFWAHNFARENSAKDLADETVRQFRLYDWDFIKIQSRAGCFAEGWGNRYAYSTERAVPPKLMEWPVHTIADLKKIQPLDPERGVLGEQLTALQAIRKEVGPEVPLILTIFAPSMVLTYLLGESPARMLELIRSNPDEAEATLAVIRDTYADYARACLQHGADGIFLGIKACSVNQMTREEYARFGLPYDQPILDAAREGWLNMLHLCGPHLYFEVVAYLPSQLLSFGLDPGNPSLSQARDRGNRCVIGGVSAKPQIRDMTPEQVASEVKAAIADTGGNRMMIGPGCSISPDTPEANLHAARQAVERWRRQE
jgi:uroporphyrinogen decarboxylase